MFYAQKNNCGKRDIEQRSLRSLLVGKPTTVLPRIARRYGKGPFYAIKKQAMQLHRLLISSIIPDPSCARRSAHRHSEGEALGGETENLLQIKQFSILSFSKGAVFSSMYVTAHLIDFITIILGRGGLFKPRHGCFLLFFHRADELCL